jgi:hypothetical protein
MENAYYTEQDRLEALRDAEGEDNTEPEAPDAPSCFSMKGEPFPGYNDLFACEPPSREDLELF